MVAAVCWPGVVALEAAPVCEAARADFAVQAELIALVEWMGGGLHLWPK